MQVSEARIRANQANALKSRGPATPEGKSVSRGNALKHGLAGEGVVVPEVDRDDVERRVIEFEADMRPESPAGSALVRRLATLSIRMEKAVRWETAEQSKNVRHAADRFDEARLDEVETLFAAIGENPRKNLRLLKKMPEGIDRLVEAWGDLRDHLTRDGNCTWSDRQLEEWARLIGLPSDQVRQGRLGRLSRGTWGNFQSLKPEDGGDLSPEARRAWCRAVLIERIDAEIAVLKAHRETLDFETIALDRAEAGERALFDQSKGACLARRYEAQAERGFFKSLDQFRQVEAESVAREEVPSNEPTPPAPGPSEKVGSFRDAPRSTDFEADLAMLEARFRAVPAASESNCVPLSITRPGLPVG